LNGGLSNQFKPVQTSSNQFKPLKPVQWWLELAGIGLNWFELNGGGLN
jgi:hypothetical protein